MKTPFEQFVDELEKLSAKTGGQGAFNLVGKTHAAILKLAKAFLELEYEQNLTSKK
jgi:hypothetical protein